MKDTTTLRLRPARPGRQQRFAELNGASWRDTPIYAELAGEWQDSGRTVPDTEPGRHRPRQNMADDRTPHDSGADGQGMEGPD